MANLPLTERIPIDAAEFKLPHHVLHWIANFDYVLLGEMHGSNEIPRLFGNIVCAVAQLKGVVLTGLEFPASEQENLQAYATSLDESLLASMSGFRNRSDDGRSSKAMFSLIAQLAKTAGVRVFAFDADTSADEAERDAIMSANIISKKQSQSSPTFILCGNIHSDKREGAFFDLAFRSMASHLNKHARANDETCLSILADFGGGQTWSKTSRDSQPPANWSFSDNAHPDAYFMRLEDVSANGHDAVIYVPTLTASPPYDV